MGKLASLALLLSSTPSIHSSILPAQQIHLEQHSAPATSPSTPPTSYTDDTPLPLIIWHGLGDNYQADGLADVAALAEAIHPGTYTYIIRLDEDASSDRSATFFGNLTLQIESVCAALSTHPILSTAPAVDALGFSQGGQFLRGYIERCNSPPVRSLVTFGSQHNGISEFQNCEAGDWVCKGASGLLRSNTWSSFVQSRLVPAQYFRDPEQLEDYLEYSNFLADINNERKLKNQTYKENLEKLERFTMILFDDDKTVVPKESGCFAEVKDGNVTKLQDRDIYKEDWIGLKKLDGEGRLVFETTKGGHMHLSDKVLSRTFTENFGAMGRKFGRKVEEGRQEEL